MLDGAWALRSGSRPLTASALVLPQSVRSPAARTILYTMLPTPSSCAPASHDVHIGSRGEVDRPHGARAPEPPPCAPVCRSPPPSASCLRPLLLKPRDALERLSSLWLECLPPPCPLCFLLQCLQVFTLRLPFPGAPLSSSVSPHRTPRWCCAHHLSPFPCFILLHRIHHHLTHDSLSFLSPSMPDHHPPHSQSP